MIRVAKTTISERSEHLKEIANDIAREVVHHVATMYPAAIAATPSTFKVSLQNIVQSRILGAISPNHNRFTDKLSANAKERLPSIRSPRNMRSSAMHSDAARQLDFWSNAN